MSCSRNGNQPHRQQLCSEAEHLNYIPCPRIHSSFSISPQKQSNKPASRYISAWLWSGYTPAQQQQFQHWSIHGQHLNRSIWWPTIHQWLLPCWWGDRHSISWSVQWRRAWVDVHACCFVPRFLVWLSLPPPSKSCSPPPSGSSPPCFSVLH